ncbi:MAG: hypothetical protein DHS20C21_09330 [Gemmatimonadota bacterium]|nr:MAG: hypothetical protein DHS20C21_09330 [Gemmatimonadota bacterium]
MIARSNRIFAALDASSPVDAIVLMNGSANFLDATFRYVSGVTRGGFEGCTAVLLPGEEPHLIVSILEEESAATAPESQVHAYANRAALMEILKTLLGRAKRIGLNGPAVPWSKVRDLQRLFPEAELIDVEEAITTARLVKDAQEVALIRAACRVTSEVAAEIPSMLRAGMTELDLSAEIAGAIQRRGGTTAFSTIVCFGKNGSEPHYSPGAVPLKPGDMILIDFGTKKDHYCSDITRMYLFGKAQADQRRMFDVVMNAQRSALELTTAGRPARDVHREASRIIDETEFAGRFIHGLGHSIGLDVHDGGGLNDASPLTLEAGMVMTIEPGVYVPGVGGVRIEDTVLVTDNGPEILTPVTKELVEVSA